MKNVSESVSTIGVGLSIWRRVNPRQQTQTTSGNLKSDPQGRQAAPADANTPESAHQSKKRKLVARHYNRGQKEEREQADEDSGTNDDEEKQTHLSPPKGLPSMTLVSSPFLPTVRAELGLKHFTRENLGSDKAISHTRSEGPIFPYHAFLRGCREQLAVSAKVFSLGPTAWRHRLGPHLIHIRCLPPSTRAHYIIVRSRTIGKRLAETTGKMCKVYESGLTRLT